MVGHGGGEQAAEEESWRGEREWVLVNGGGGRGGKGDLRGSKSPTSTWSGGGRQGEWRGEGGVG